MLSPVASWVECICIDGQHGQQHHAKKRRSANVQINHRRPLQLNVPEHSTELQTFTSKIEAEDERNSRLFIVFEILTDDAAGSHTVYTQEVPVRTSPPSQGDPEP